MKLETYSEILNIMHMSESRECLSQIAELYPAFSIRTLGSIYSQDYQRKMKKSHHRHYATDRMLKYYTRYQEECKQGTRNILLKMADESDLSPALLARIVLDRHLAFTRFGNEPVPKSLVTQMLKDTCLIDDPILAHEIQMCSVADDVYGPIVDTIKHSIGHEYEFLLKKRLSDRNLPFLGEDQLRAKGYDKTPDVKLEIPIAVGGHVINWIESKASFGDEESHEGYLKEQFWSYWNRFGPGLVIYWFGFIDELDVNREKGIMLTDRFPQDLVTMKPSALAPR